MRRSATDTTLIIVLVAMTGCMGLSKVEMSTADRAQTKTVNVRADSKLPDSMALIGKGVSIGGGLGGIAGATAGYAIDQGSKGPIQDAMERNKIDLLGILRTEFEKALRSHSDFSIVDENSKADAEMTLYVNSYGLAPPHGLSSTLYPLINVSASLRKPDGTVIWQRTDKVLPQNKENNRGHRFEEYVEKPEFLRETWTNVSGIVSRMLVQELSD